MAAQTNYLALYGPKLIEQGYDITPILPGAKRPRLSNWQNRPLTAEQCQRMAANGGARDGVGILTRNTPAIDIDVHDEAFVARIIAYCEATFGVAPVRVGQPPKAALLFRCETPFGKLATPVYEDYLGIRHQVEVLCRGQQVVGYHEHQDTKQPYTWRDKGAADIPHDALPLLTVEQAEALLQWIDANKPDDWRVVAPGSTRGGSSDTAGMDAEERKLANYRAKPDVSEEEIDRTLETLSADAEEYGTWFSLGMQLHHQYDGSPEGLAKWDEWSRRGAKYEEGACEKKWRTFKNRPDRESQTFRSALKRARIIRQEQEGNPLDALIQRHIYVKEGNRVHDLEDRAGARMDLLHEFKNELVGTLYPQPTKKDPDKMGPIYNEWMKHKTTVKGETFVPHGPRVVTAGVHQYVNRCQMPEYEPTETTDQLDLWFDYMHYMFPNKEERDWFFGWLAFNVQYPLSRSDVTPLHIAEIQGTGRGWMVRFIQKLLGEDNCSNVTMSELCDEKGGKFNGYLHNSLMCSVEEVGEGRNRYAVDHNLRTILTTPRHHVNVKHGKAGTERVFTNFFFMSNEWDCLHLEENDRRINVLAGPDYRQPEAFYEAIYRWIGDARQGAHQETTEGLRQAYWWLMRYDLSHTNFSNSIKNASRERLMHSSRSPTETLFWELKSDPERRWDYLSFRGVADALERMDGMDGSVNEKELLKLLKQHARRPDVKQVRIGQARTRPWQLDGERFDEEKMKQDLEEQASDGVPL